MILMFQPRSWVSLRVAPRLLGFLAPCILLVDYARWQMWALQWNLKSQWAQHQGNLLDSIQVSEETAKDLQWWLLDPSWTRGRPLSLPHPELTVTDTLFLG